jgi:phosphatidylglycerophosphate synthase
MADKIGIETGDRATADNYDPVDRVFLYLSHRMNTLLHDTVPVEYAGSEGNPSPIPNLLTLTGLLAAAAATAAVLHHRRILAAGLWIVAYFFDCADGNYARRYDSATKLGDLLDHVGDGAKVLGLAVALWYTSGMSLSEYVVDRKVGLLVAALAGLASVGAAGCLEKKYKESQPGIEHSKTMELAEFLCPLSISGATGPGIVFAVVFPALVATRAV